MTVILSDEEIVQFAEQALGRELADWQRDYLCRSLFAHAMDHATSD